MQITEWGGGGLSFQALISILCILWGTSFKFQNKPGMTWRLRQIPQATGLRVTLAMLAARNDGEGRHCERSEAIQLLAIPLDCFVAALLAMTDELPRYVA
jgi:hypothetical protein